VESVRTVEISVCGVASRVADPEGLNGAMIVSPKARGRDDITEAVNVGFYRDGGGELNILVGVYQWMSRESGVSDRKAVFEQGRCVGGYVLGTSVKYDLSRRPSDPEGEWPSLVMKVEPRSVRFGRVSAVSKTIGKLILLLLFVKDMHP
jgi:hypothetical protein